MLGCSARNLTALFCICTYVYIYTLTLLQAMSRRGCGLDVPRFRQLPHALKLRIAAALRTRTLSAFTELDTDKDSGKDSAYLIVVKG
jgi:hypothetical protein